MNNNRIQTTELDFDAIKENLKNYLKGQSQFSDYDFEGSGLNILLDVLAYNTHYNALYLNLAVNEAFLDSASKRSSVVSKAKELGYVPRSASSATAVVDIMMLNDQLTAPSTATLPAYSPFTSIVDTTTYTFYTTEAYTAVRSGNQYLFPDVILREGSFLQYRYEIIDNTSINIPNGNVDLSTLTVSVQETAQSSATEVFVRSTTILNVDANSAVYFIKENEDGTYTVEFGNGVVGKQLSSGNVVTISYLVCNDEAANGAGTFTFAGTAPANTTVYVTTTTTANGGAVAEDVDSIKWNAPRAYAAQNRCVTAEDYKTIITSNYPGIKAIAVWGGEDNTPPEYGKVYISVVPKDTDFLTEAQQQYILDYIVGPRKPLAVTPVFTNPTYLKIQLDVAFYYNPALTTRSVGDLITIVQDTILDYDAANLKSFGDVFKMSRLSGLIDNSETAITSNIMTLKLHRGVTPVYNIVSGYTINIGNPIYNSGVGEQSVLSSGFYSAETTEVCYIEDQPLGEASTTGNLRLFYINSSGAKVYLRNVGTIDYTAGIISIADLNVTGLFETSWNFVIKPQSNDVASLQNQFIEIDPTLLTITPVIDTPTKTYTFTSSRN